MGRRFVKKTAKYFFFGKCEVATLMINRDKKTHKGEQWKHERRRVASGGRSVEQKKVRTTYVRIHHSWVSWKETGSGLRV